MSGISEVTVFTPSALWAPQHRVRSTRTARVPAGARVRPPGTPARYATSYAPTIQYHRHTTILVYNPSSLVLRTHPGTDSPVLRAHPRTDSPVLRTHPRADSPVLRTHPGTDSPVLWTHPDHDSPVLWTHPDHDSPVLRTHPRTDSLVLRTHPGTDYPLFYGPIPVLSIPCSTESSRS